MHGADLFPGHFLSLPTLITMEMITMTKTAGSPILNLAHVLHDPDLDHILVRDHQLLGRVLVLLPDLLVRSPSPDH